MNKRGASLLQTASEGELQSMNSMHLSQEIAFELMLMNQYNVYYTMLYGNIVKLVE